MKLNILLVVSTCMVVSRRSVQCHWQTGVYSPGFHSAWCLHLFCLGLMSLLPVELSETAGPRAFWEV